MPSPLGFRFALRCFAGGAFEIVSDDKRDWQSLEVKLAAGKSLEDAACEAGIPLEEAQARAASKLQNGDALGYEVIAVAQRALSTAIEKLTAIADEGPRSTDDNNSDVVAAQALARLAMDIFKMTGVARQARKDDPKARLRVKLDLFDGPGNWKLKTPD